MIAKSDHVRILCPILSIEKGDSSFFFDFNAKADSELLGYSLMYHRFEMLEAGLIGHGTENDYLSAQVSRALKKFQIGKSRIIS